MSDSQKDFGVYAEPYRLRIEPGEYDAVCYRVELGYSFGNRRDCYVLFRLHGGQYDEVELFMACPYPKGKLSRRTKFYTQWMLATQRAPHKKERLSPRVFPHKMYRVLLRNTRRKFPDTNKLMPDYLQYSVVGTILETLTGVPPHVSSRIDQPCSVEVRNHKIT